MVKLSAFRVKDDNRDIESRYDLLKAEVAIPGDQQIEFLLRLLQ
jgi:hypothetical protein